MTRAPWMVIGLRELGVHETPGPAHTARVVEYHATTTLKATDDETPWCSAFVNWVMVQAGIPGSGAANARSWLQWGQAEDTIRYGAIVVLRRGANPAAGHVGFSIDGDETRLWLLSGNSRNAVCVAAYPRNHVVGVRWPA